MTDVSFFGRDVGGGISPARAARFDELHQIAFRILAIRLLHVWQAIERTALPYQDMGGTWTTLWELAALVLDAELDKRMSVLVVDAPACPLPFWLAADGSRVSCVCEASDACEAGRKIAARLGVDVAVMQAPSSATGLEGESIHRIFAPRIATDAAGRRVAAECGRLLSPGGMLAVSWVLREATPSLLDVVRDTSEASGLSPLGPLDADVVMPYGVPAVAFFIKHGTIDLGIDRVLEASPLPKIASDVRFEV